MVLLLLAFLHATHPARAQELRCPVHDTAKDQIESGRVSADRWRRTDREATPREALRLAVSEWRDTESKSNNRQLDPDWFDTFEGCLEVAGVPFEQVVTQPASFRHLFLRTQALDAKDLEANRDARDVRGDLDSFDRRMKRMAELDPAFAQTHEFRGVQLTDKQRQTLEEDGEYQAKLEKRRCEGQDLSAALGPVRDQEDIGWCYGFAASDLVTHYARTHGHPDAEAVSAADLTMQTNRQLYEADARAGLKPSEQEGGYTDKAILHALAEGFCPERIAPSQDYSFGSLKESLQELEGLKRSIVMGESNGQCRAYFSGRELFPGIPMDDFLAILTRAGDRHEEMLEKMTARNCQGHRRKFELTKDHVHNLTAAEGKAKPRQFLDAIHEQLDKGNVVGLGVRASVLGPSFSGGHAMVIVGRRYDAERKSCEFLVRNSWGPRCGSSLRGGICSAEHPGHLWLSSKQLTDYTTSVTYLE